MQIKLTISNSLILISLIVTLLAFYNPNIYIFWINTNFLEEWIYHIYFIQFFSWVFLHWTIMHFLFNSVFIYFFWNIVENIIWKNKFLSFFIFISIFNWILLTFFTNDNTIWISWFCMALIAYYTLELKSKNNPDYKWWITAIIINIWIWLVPWISLLWHLFWAIWWIIFYIINKKFLKEKWVWVTSTSNI